MNCTPQSLLAAARCYQCIPQGIQMGVQTSLLNEISGANLSVDQLIYNARCIASCIPPGMLDEVKTRLLCERVDSLAPSLPSVVCDSDAQAFINAAGITVQAQKDAICILVASLKNNGTPPFWDSEIILYPFVGGTASQHSYNLRNPALYQLTYGGVPAPTHDQFGMLGNGASAYANTQYIPRTGPPATDINNCRVYSYHYTKGTVASNRDFGCQSDASSSRTMGAATAVALFQALNSSNLVSKTGGNGGFIISTRDGVTFDSGYNGGAFTHPALTKTNSPNSVMLLLAMNNLPPVNPVNFSNGQLCGFSMGSRGLTEHEWFVYQGIWQDFQTSLGRQRP